MTLLEQAQKGYQERSKSASDISRQLAYVGIALIWIFKLKDHGGRDVVDPRLLTPTHLLVIALASDLLQFVIAAGIFGFIARKIEKHPEDFAALPRWVNWPSVVLFWFKIVIVLIAYVLILDFLQHQVG
jgi:hypothetical protein